MKMSDAQSMFGRSCTATLESDKEIRLFFKDGSQAVLSIVPPEDSDGESLLVVYCSEVPEQGKEAEVQWKSALGCQLQAEEEEIPA